jgi:hypothetical protein
MYDEPTPILAFWNYLPLVYCVKSFASSTDLTQRLDRYMKDAQFLVAEINVRNINGMLGAEAWQWFYEPVQTQRPLAGSQYPLLPPAQSSQPPQSLAELLKIPLPPPKN